MAETLAISVTFPNGVYSGSDLGAAEELPAPARVHEAFVAAAAGGSWATADGRVLVAAERHRNAVVWLEDNEPVGLLAPPTVLNPRPATRYRERAAPGVKKDTGFEPSAAVSGPIVYLWPPAPPDVLSALSEISAEITHVGRTDSIARVAVTAGTPEPHGDLLQRVDSRGPGRVMRLPSHGRFDHLEKAHREASQAGPHKRGNLTKQARDEQLPGPGVNATRLARFAEAALAESDWPYEDMRVMAVIADASVSKHLRNAEHRVPTAVAIHRALIRRLADDVPAFVTGRDGDGPLRDAGHLAIHVACDPRANALVALFALPPGTSDADRARFDTAVSRPLRVPLHVRGRIRGVTLEPAHRAPALPYWPTSSRLLWTEVPMIVDSPGRPRQGPWSLDDAVTCSIGYAMRGVLERRGERWGKGWAFRASLVETLRDDYGVVARARRATRPATRYVHRAAHGELLIAAEALVDLGELAPHAGGFLAIGRARHLGGGLLRPVAEPRA